MTAGIAFRHAQLADISSVVALVESAYRGDASRAGWTTEADMLEGQRIDAQRVRADIENTDSIILLAEQGTGELIACCHLQKNAPACYFGMFSVSPLQQGHGIGKRLINEAERIAQQEWHCTRMEMTVIDIRDELIDFYLRRGYLRTGKHLPFPYGDERFGIPLRDDLRFEILEKSLHD